MKIDTFSHFIWTTTQSSETKKDIKMSFLSVQRHLYALSVHLYAFICTKTFICLFAVIKLPKTIKMIMALLIPVEHSNNFLKFGL